MLSLEALEAEWIAALAHAKVSSDRARLYPCDAAAADDGGGSGAVWHPPGGAICRGPHFPAPLPLDHANSPENMGRHRIVIWRDNPAPVIGARLRHEIEHARQCDDDEANVRLYDLVRDNVLSRKEGGLTGAVINSIPAEEDCNAAAAAFLRARHPASIEAILASDNRLLASTPNGPEPLETLPARMVAFLAGHQELCEDYADTQQATFPDLLEWRWKGAGDLWRALTRG